jgi:hypothetical protein
VSNLTSRRLDHAGVTLLLISAQLGLGLIWSAPKKS